jgi:ribonuclease PH
LRAAVDLNGLGPRTITLDCDVIQADGGTRTASVTGAYIALHRACTRLVAQGLLPAHPVKTAVAAVSVGVVEGEILLDLCYAEDSRADVDFNVVMTAGHEFIEVQGTGEGAVFSRTTMDAMLDLAETGIIDLLQIQQKYV